MKQFFEEPKVFVERFNVNDQTLTVSFVTADVFNDETTAYGINAITSD